MSTVKLKHGSLIAKTSLFIALSFGINIAYAEYWIDSPPIQPVGCGYVYKYGFSSCQKRVNHKYKHNYAKKKHSYRYPHRVNYRVEAYYYGPAPCYSGGCYVPTPPPVRVSCNSCSCGSCGGAVEYVRGDGSYYSDVTMGGYPSYPYVNYDYSQDQATGDDNVWNYRNYVTYTH